MYARAVDDASARLRVLRREQWERLSLGAVAHVLAVVAAEFLPQLAIPLFVGGLSLVLLGLQAFFRHWDLVEQLSGERDAYVIPEVLAYASREAGFDRRHGFAVTIRGHLRQPGLVRDAPVVAAAEELEALAQDLEDCGLALDPATAIACIRLLISIGESDLCNSPLSSEELCSRVRQIRSGFSAQPTEGLN